MARSPARLFSNLQFAICKLQFAILLRALVLFILCWFLFFRGLGDRDLWSSHEARAAQDAQTMLLDGQWGLPHLFDRKVELQKPPLYYWLVAAIGYIRGGSVDAWAVRLPAAGGALACVLLVFGLGCRRGRPLLGFIAASMLATAVHFTWLAQTGRIDMPLTFMVTLTLSAFYLGRRRSESGGDGAWCWFLLAYGAAALAMLLKGPIGLLLPAAVIGLFLLVERELPAPWQFGRWMRLGHALGLWWGLPLTFGLALPWYIWANTHTGGALLQVFFWEHNIERGLGGGALRAHPWWFYGPQLVVDFLPWSPLLPLAVWLFFRIKEWRLDPEARFGLVWLVAVTLVLSCARFKRSDYLLPAYPGAALFLGSVAERWVSSLSRRRALAAGYALLLAAVVLGWTLYLNWTLPQLESQHDTRGFAAEIRRRAPAPQLILFFRSEAHALAFHVGRPIDTLLEWENLDIWAARPETYYVVMPSEYARQWAQHLKSGRLEIVLWSTILAGATHDDPLVLLRTKPGAGPP
jgi:4-amino-4-deoxy-L-arabinose transferase-like glycosyltransferase